ncbi:hypothetical protein EN41_22160 [Agrobacterium tumefaciens]|nr:hypothetical protein EN41_22160 [Agrobacterium tumefaciens]
MLRRRRDGVTSDHEFLSHRTFGLYPFALAAGHIFAAFDLGNHAFEAEPAGMVQHQRATFLEMLAVAEMGIAGR